MSEDMTMEDLEIPEGLDANKIPTFTQLPLGRLQFAIKGWSQDTVATAPRGMPDGEKVPKVVVKVQFSVSQTPDGRFIGLPYNKTFWIGSDADPMAKSPATWMANAGPLMKVLKKAKVATGRGLKFRNMMDAAVESSLLGEVKKSKKTERVDIMDFLSVGEKPIEYFGDGGPGPMERPVSAPTHSAEQFEND